MFKPETFEKKDFLSSLDLNLKEFLYVLHLAKKLKNDELKINLGDKVLGLVFDKSSTRTRVSFQVAMARLGCHTLDLNPQTSQIGRGEPIKDTARVLSRYCDAIAIRTYNHSDLEDYAKWSSKPVINALTDLEHPCQALADYLTILEEFGSFDNLILTFVGDGNNVANSLILCAAILDLEIRIACPEGYEPNPQILEKARKLYDDTFKLKILNDPIKAATGANILYTDVWASMGEEDEKEKKDKAFKGFAINQDLVNKANKNAIVMHCLPAYRDKEITEEVIDSKNSRIFDQAENRLHAQQALLTCLLS